MQGTLYKIEPPLLHFLGGGEGYWKNARRLARETFGTLPQNGFWTLGIFIQKNRVSTFFCMQFANSCYCLYTQEDQRGGTTRFNTSLQRFGTGANFGHKNRGKGNVTLTSTYMELRM